MSGLRLSRTSAERLYQWRKEPTDNEQGWIEFIRLISKDTDPAPTLERVQRLREVFAEAPTS